MALRFNTEKDYKDFISQRKAIGGRARAEALSPEQRTEIAKKGADARWGKERNKYGNNPKEVDGILFQSTKEANRYLILKAWQQSGQIQKLEWQKPFSIEVEGEHICDYIADFVYQIGWSIVVEDVKSKTTRKLPVYQLKKKLMKAVHKIDIVEI